MAFIKDYNPKYDDIFLYDSSNTGMPIGLNPNHELYRYKNFISAINCRVRQWSQINPDYPSGPPVGTPLSQYPNYYNNGQSLHWWISPTLIGSCIHYQGTLPSDVAGSRDLSKKTRVLQDSNIRYFWSDLNFNGFTGYGPFYNIYNCVSSSDVRTTNIESRYFSGSPEIPGFTTGNTFYKVLPTDFGVLEQVTPRQRNLNPVKIISIHSILQNTFGTDVLVNKEYVFPYNFYIWDGQDRIIPITVSVTLEYYLKENSINYTINVHTTGDRYITGYFGDSSSLLIYKTNSELYLVGHAPTVGGIITHANEIYPVNEYFVNKNVAPSNIVYSLNSQPVGATAAKISTLNTSLSNTSLNFSNKIVQLQSGITPTITYDVISSFADYGMSNAVLDLIVPTLQSNNIKPGLVLYNTPFLEALGTGGQINAFNQSLYSTSLSNELNSWTSANNKNSYFGSYPYQIMMDFEISLMFGPYGFVYGTEFIGDWTKNSIELMNELINASQFTKSVTPNSIVYHYDCPYIPRYAYGTSIDLLAASNSPEYISIIRQFTEKCLYIKDSVDLFDIGTYNAFYENAVAYKQATYDSWLVERFKALNTPVFYGKKKQISASFVLYPGSDNDIPYPNSLSDVQNLGRLIFTNNFMQNRLFSVAKSYGFTNLFLWENWLYRVMIAQSSPATTDVYLTRKTFNDLFYDLDHSDNGYNLTDNTTWSSPAAQTKMYQAVLTKTVQLANLFRS